MNKQTIQNLLVGITALVSIAALIFVILFLRGKLNNDKIIKVVFTDVMGVKPGQEVGMAGVQIGQIDAIRLTPDHRAELTLGIRRQFDIPRGSRFLITTKVLGNTGNVEVIPPAQPTGGPIAEGETVKGESRRPVDFALEESAKTLAESRALIRQGQELVATLNAFVGDPRRQRNLDRLIASSANLTERLNTRLDRTLANTTVLTENLRRLSEQLPEIKMQVDVLLADLRATSASGKRAAQGVEGLTGDARLLTQSLTGTVNENRKTLSSLLESAEEAAGSVAALTNEVKGLVGDKAIRENLVTTTDNIEAATANLVAISAKFDTAADNLQKLTGDEKLNADLRATVTNLRETTASFRNLAARVEQLRLPGERRAPVPANGGTDNTPARRTYFSSTSLLEPGFVINSLYDTDRERARADFDYTLITGGKGTFYRLGIFDAGETNRLNLQVGQANAIPAGLAYRYGFIGGKLGLGLDLRTGPLDWRLDFFDPNRGTANLRTKTYLNRDASLTFGMDAIGRENRATLGVQLRR
ncbi:MAG: MlaD family protein [Capsulimonadales bacterium]|nr:MlaD family protein [Capsulimonadales bacterium]